MQKTDKLTFQQCVGIILTAALCLTPAFLHSTGNPAKTVAHYTVSSMGFTIGDITTTQRVTDEGGAANLSFETRSAVKASFLWLGYSLHTIEKGTLRKGELASYTRKGMENGATVDVEGRLENAAFRFDLHEQGATRSIVIPRSSYDYTTMECPEARLDFSGKTQIALNILDVEKMVVVKRKYHLVKNDYYSVGDKKLPCRVVDYADKNKKARRWIAWDGSAVVMYRQDGRGEESSYSVQATSVVKEM